MKGAVWKKTQGGLCYLFVCEVQRGGWGAGEWLTWAARMGPAWER